MGLFFNKKANEYAVGLLAWAHSEAQHASDPSRKSYLVGVQSAVQEVTVSIRPRPIPEQVEAALQRQSEPLQAQMGHDDAIALLQRIQGQRIIPTRDYSEVLAEPYSARL